MANDLKRNLVNRLKQAGAYDARIADPKVGFEHALKGKHPLDVWSECRSVVVFVVATSPKSNNLYIGPHAPWQGPRRVGPVPPDIQSDNWALQRLSNLFITSVTLKGIAFLGAHGYSTVFSDGHEGLPALPQLKLLAFEAGVGVYGRSGLIIHPVLGNRLRLGAFLTDAVLEPDGRLDGFAPCQGCDRCVRMCPAQAFDPNKEYPESWSRDICVGKRAQITDTGYYCHNCFAVCPAGTIPDDRLLSSAEAVSFYEPHR